MFRVSILFYTEHEKFITRTTGRSYHNYISNSCHQEGRRQQEERVCGHGDWHRPGNNLLLVSLP